jgi:hypothetical protein
MPIARNGGDDAIRIHFTNSVIAGVCKSSTRFQPNRAR